MNLKKLTRIILLVAVLLVLSIVPVNAVVFNAAFDSDFYVNCYPDLKAAFGNDANAAYDHYLTYGIKEGRIASPVFDVKTYIRNYPDLQAAFGDNYEAAYNHFLANGMNEGRLASDSFNVQVYIANYPDLQAAFGNDVAGAYNHYLNYGMAEGRVCGALEAGAEAPEDHVHDYSIIVEYITEPTCQEDGEVIYACECGEVSTETVIIPASEEYHVYEEDDDRRIDPTCIADGKKIFVCTVCQDEEAEKEEVIPMGEEYHDWDKVISKGDPEYTGLEIYECTICSEYKAVPYNCEHEYEMVSTTATCTKAGVETRVCKNCKDIEKVDVPATGHTVTQDAVITVPATCTTDGKAVGTCDECGKSAIEVVIPAAHKYEEADDNKEATCTEGGLLSKICSVCGDKIYERTEATGHTEPETGVKTYVATPNYDAEGKVTGYTKTSEEIDITKTTLVNRTLCVNGIVKEFTCENCEETVTDTVYEVKGHNYKTTVKPTCTTDGKKVCSVCTDVTAEHEVILPATGHTLTGYAVASTSEEDKYYVNCSECGILTATLDKDAKTITLVDVTGEEWGVTITYKQDGTTIQSIKIGEKGGTGDDETTNPDKTPLSISSVKAGVHQSATPQANNITVSSTGKTVTVTETAEKVEATTNPNGETKKFFCLVLDLGIAKDKVKVSAGDYKIEANDLTCVDQWTTSSNGNQFLVWLSAEKCGNSGITITFSDADNVKAPIDITFNFVANNA